MLIIYFLEIRVFLLLNQEIKKKQENNTEKVSFISKQAATTT